MHLSRHPSQHFVFKNKILNAYLKYVEETESPRIFHIWSLLSAVGACTGRRSYVNLGNMERIYLNLYVFLVGPVSARKSTAMKIVKHLVEDHTKVRFGPDDTGGQRQGLIASMTGKDKEKEEISKTMDKVMEMANMMELANDIQTSDDTLDLINQFQTDLRDQHTIYIAAPELVSILGQGQFDLLTFLIKMWDSDPYTYQLKNSETTMKDGLIHMIGCCTPTNLATSLPKEAMGQGFMSRVILVYADRIYKEVEEPNLNKDVEHTIVDRLKYIHDNVEGEIRYSPDALILHKTYNRYQPKIDDPRFIYYGQRRAIQLRKLAACLSLLRSSSQVIEIEDVEEAHLILQVTERDMPEALGEFGLNTLSAAKQKLYDFINLANEPKSISILWAYMSRDMKRSDFITCIQELQNVGKIKSVHTDVGQMFVAKEQSETRGGLGMFNELLLGMPELFQSDESK